MQSRCRNPGVVALVLLLFVAAIAYFFGAQENGRRVNTDISRTDQGAYIKYAIALRESDFTTVGRRNRMPAYPALLATFIDKGETPDGFFEKGKLINTWLSLVGLVFLGTVFLRTFPRHAGLNILFLAGFGVFVFKAAYVQAEILYYLLTFAVFFLSWKLFRKPRILVALLAGGLIGVAHLTKASVVPGLLVVAVFYPLDAIWQFFTGREKGTIRPLVRLAVILLMTGTFFATVYPYLAKSKEIYGRYFYNVNSTFYFWCESWKDAGNRTKAAGDRKGWPEMPEDEIPSLKNYLRTHSVWDIGGRIFSGISRVVNSMARSYGYLWIFLAYVAFGLWVAWCKHRVIWKLIYQRPFPVAALAAYFIGYFLLIAWYSQIIQGNRFILGLFLPFLFSVTALICAFGRRLEIRLGQGMVLPAVPVFNTLISAWLAVDILITFFFRLGTVYGGS
jgi:hypothetical protein